MQRSVTAELDLDLRGPVDLVLQIATSQEVPVTDEELRVTAADGAVAVSELVDAAGNRLHRIAGHAGPLRVRYCATVTGSAPPTRTGELDAITSLRPSRYCPSDELFTGARREFAGLHGRELLAAVTGFVADGVTYTPGASLGTDSALTTLQTGQGVCRDYAHLVIALLRAMDVPARYVACYAPGLVPMDFHAVAEAYLDGSWYVLDATRLTDRRSLVRIATGRDAADCAFLSFHGGYVGLDRLHVDATSDEPVTAPDHAALVMLA